MCNPSGPRNSPLSISLVLSSPLSACTKTNQTPLEPGFLELPLSCISSSTGCPQDITSKGNEIIASSLLLFLYASIEA